MTPSSSAPTAPRSWPLVCTSWIRHWLLLTITARRIYANAIYNSVADPLKHNAPPRMCYHAESDRSTSKGVT